MIIWWIRRDLRLDDNTALGAALEQSGGAVVPVFVLDDVILSSPMVAPARVRFLLESLRELDQALRERGSRLIVRRGSPTKELLRLADETGAEAVFFNRDYEPYARERDQGLLDAFAARGKRAQAFADQLLVEPEEATTTQGKVATVYTPFRRRWLARLEAEPGLTANRSDSGQMQFAPLPDDLESLSIPTPAELGFEARQQIVTPGAAAGLALFRAFIERDGAGLRDYHRQRNNLGIEGTSRLGAHFRFGTLAARTAAREVLAVREQTSDAEVRKACEGWLGELAWRDFYTSIMFHFPHVLERPYKPLFERFPFRESGDDFGRWMHGSTGYPVVDAAMRQLNREGFMHNRARMIVASFLVKDLLLDYRLGERYFMQHLTCGEAGVNNGNWQWVAGSSNDPQPFFRIFNPVTQGQTYDSEGKYVRRYVSELATVPNEYIHAPWTMPEAVAQRVGFKLGRDYPEPMVDHKEARARALAALKQARAATSEE